MMATAAPNKHATTVIIPGVRSRPVGTASVVSVVIVSLRSVELTLWITRSGHIRGTT
jgi:hypothetical protein